MLHRHFKQVWVKPLLLVLLFSTVLLQAGMAGGDYYEIYLNKKLIVRQHVGAKEALMNLPLLQANSNDLLKIHYSHCGAIGKGRKIVVKNDRNVVLKEWRFADADGSDVYMSIPVKHLSALQQSHAASGLKLYYFSSQQLPEGRMLASINNSGKNVARR